MNCVVVIPARMASSRLPGKALADIAGSPMVVRVLEAATAAAVGPVVVAAGDAEIAAVVRGAGGEAVLTDPALPSGSDRVVAALADFDPGRGFETVINLQGDMPFVKADALRRCVDLLEAKPACDLSTVVAPESSPADRLNPNVVKAILAMDEGGEAGRALYFTRSALYGEGAVWRHVGVYAWRRGALERFSQTPPSALERRENLEQLRALEMDLAVWTATIASAPISVDTPADLAAARRYAEACA
jgi:3-deoxy-manno-octulosonate cytidylyltransferase (CMP-KDO synthetase)